MADQDDVIRTTGISKSFAGVQALSGVDFRVRPAQIHALLGQNGAGKSTLVKILNGVYPTGSFSGTVALAGQQVSFRSPDDARTAGVGYVPQEIEVLEQLTVAENVFAGRMGLGRGLFIHRREVRAQTNRIISDIGIDMDPDAIVASLTSAQRHLVMIARALALQPRVLMLDEPTASLSGHEVDALFGVLRRLRAQGVTMIYITHRLPEVLDICDSATVLRDGKVAAELVRADFNEEKFIFSMSGLRMQRRFPERMASIGTKTVLSVRDLTVAGHSGAIFGARDVSFNVAAGEIVGLAGLLGSGRSEILHGIYGRVPSTGDVSVNGQTVHIHSPKDARAAGIALLTEDRKRDGLLFNLPVGANITIGNLENLSRNGVLYADKERIAVRHAMRELNVKAGSAQSSVAHLSGGNQQKLLFARVLMRSPQVLLLDEPTKGVDASTRAEIYRLIMELAEKGVAMVIVASELEEVIGLCDRCLTIADGRIVDEFQRGDGGEERVLRAIAAAQARTHASAMQEAAP